MRNLSRWKSVEMCIHDETRSDCVSGLAAGQLIKGQEQSKYVVLLSGRAEAGSPPTQLPPVARLGPPRGLRSW